jgi:hypothetical protein
MGWMRSLPRAALAAILGAAVTVAAVLLVTARRPAVLLEMDRDVPRPVASGFFPVELTPGVTFAWTGATAAVRLPGLDRHVAWTCEVLVRGGRAAGTAQPTVTASIDGVAVASLIATNSYQALRATAPRLPSANGLRLSIDATHTFVPGPADPRELGVQVDRIACAPEGGALIVPPGPALAAAAATGAVFGAMLSLLGLAWWGAAGVMLLVTVAQAWAFSTGVAAFTSYPPRLARIAAVIAAATLSALAVARWRRPVRPEARWVLALSAATLFVELLGLLHPSKLVIDAVFQAHRLEWVLAGRYLFTQPMPDGVRFPYAIALYVAAAPWTVLTTDYVTLLRIVVCVARAVAAAALYPMVTRTWGDARAGVLAVVLVHLVPLPYLIIGNANLTFAFGQSVAMATLAAATAWRLDARDVAATTGIFLLASLAFLSHVGIFPVLLLVLMGLAICCRWLCRPPFRAAARNLAIATVAAALLSVVSYYGRFGEAYQSLERVVARAVAVVRTDATPAQPVAAPEAAATPAPTPEVPSRAARAVSGLARGVRAVGWPMALLAALGAWCTWKTGFRDRMGLALIATTAAYLVFLGFAVLAPVEPRFLRYNDEFIDRLSYASLPLAVLLGARGASEAWALSLPTRLVAAGLGLAALALAAGRWLVWLE